MKNTKLISATIGTIGIFLSFANISANAFATISANTQDGITNKSDNTAVNIRDRSSDEPAADQAKNNLSDREVMQKIRKSVMADKSLSTYAHNVKIISEDGNVTLKGPVRSDAERQTIEDKAAEVAGAENITNEISVKGHTNP